MRRHDDGLGGFLGDTQGVQIERRMPHDVRP